MEGYIKKVLENLKLKRRVFYSEADLQFEFAWELHKILPEAEIRLERPVTINNEVYYIDIWVNYEDRHYPIELKYKTKSIIISDFNKEDIHLANHGAVNLGCYAYIKDISRIEDIKEKDKKFGKGFAMMLTNEPIYYNQINRRSSYQLFKIYNGREINGTLDWEHTQTDNEFALKDKFPPLNLKGKYKIIWFDYAIDNHSPNFKYTITKIE